MVNRHGGVGKIGTILGAFLWLGVACANPHPAASSGGPADRGSTGPVSPIDGLYFNGHSVLRVQTGRWSLQAESLRMDGRIEVSQSRLVLSKETTCPDAGAYAWSFAGRTLTLQIQEDPCPGRDVIVNGAWKPIQSVGHTTKAGTYVALPDLHLAFYTGQRDVSAEKSAEIDVMIREQEGWFFSPTVLRGSPGQRLQLTIRNPKGPGLLPFGHNFSLPDQGIAVDIPSGGQATVSISFPASGSLTFFCLYHADHGQAGALTVSS